MWTIDHCQVQGLTLEGLAAGGEATSIRVPELGVIFDMGVCLPECIAHRYHTLLLSHGHSDHAAALVYMLGQRSMRGLPPMRVYLPEELLEPVQALIATWQRIEGYDRPADFVPLVPGQSFKLVSGQEGVALRTPHRVPSLAYVLAKRKTPGFVPQICVTGDTKIEFMVEQELARHSEVLVHEVTAWDEQRSVAQTRERGHTHVDEILAHAQLFDNKSLVLVHRSSRHPRTFAQKVVNTRFPPELAAKTRLFG